MGPDLDSIDEETFVTQLQGLGQGKGAGMGSQRAAGAGSALTSSALSRLFQKVDVGEEYAISLGALLLFLGLPLGPPLGETLAPPAYQSQSQSQGKNQGQGQGQGQGKRLVGDGDDEFDF